MGRIRRAWQYEREAAQARAREAYFRDRERPESATVRSRGEMVDVFYRSLHLKEGSDHLIFRTQVPEVTLQKISLAQAGLLNALPSGQAATRLKGSGVRPTKVHWYKGAANATRRRTAWGTMSTRYYQQENNRSHYSIPFSDVSGDFDGDTLIDRFNSLFGPTGTLTAALLGDNNGRAYIEWEQVSYSAQT